jgi:hypothetical protein
MLSVLDDASFDKVLILLISRIQRLGLSDVLIGAGIHLCVRRRECMYVYVSIFSTLKIMDWRKKWYAPRASPPRVWVCRGASPRSCFTSAPLFDPFLFSLQPYPAHYPARRRPPSCASIHRRRLALAESRLLRSTASPFSVATPYPASRHPHSCAFSPSSSSCAALGGSGSAAWSTRRSGRAAVAEDWCPL